MGSNDIGADPSVGHAGQHNPVGIDSVPRTHYPDELQDELLCPACPPIPFRECRTGQDIVVTQTWLPTLQVCVASKPESMQTDDEGVFSRRLIGLRHVETIAELLPPDANR